MLSVAAVAAVAAMLLSLLGMLAPLTPHASAHAAHTRAHLGPLAGSSHLSISPALVNETLGPGDPPTSTNAVSLTNNGAGASTWAITSTLPTWLGVTPISGTLASGASVSLTLTFSAPGTPPTTTPQTFATTLVFSDPNADDSPLSLPVTLSIGTYARTWYFAEGYTGTGFTEYLTLANPNPDPANVVVQYLLQGALPLTRTYSVLSNARYTINVNSVVGPGQSVALAIASDLPIIAERPMYFTYTGLTGVSIPGGSDTLGATSLGTTFAFAYLDTTANHDTYLTVLNQNSVAILATVAYYPAAGGTPTYRLHTIPARSRGTIRVRNEGLGAGTFSAIVTLSATSPNTQTPALGLVERPMYLVDAVTGQTGAADVIGLPTGSMNWDFAEGYTSPTFSERYILANPLSTTASRATITFYRADGTTAQQVVALQPGQQQVVDANTVLGSGGVNNSAHISADQPILAERFISFIYEGPVGVSGSASLPGATDVLGATQPSDLYYFAEGYTGDVFAEYLTVENPNPSTVSLQVTFLPANGAAPTVKQYSIGPTSRFTLLTNRVMVGQSFSMIVQASGPVVAERPMYFNYNAAGQTGGTDVIGYAPHATAIFNQGYCGSCLYVTTDSLNSGGLDQTTGLLEWTNQTDAAAYGNPYNGEETFTTVQQSSQYANGPIGLVAFQQGYPLWSYYPGQSSYLDGYGIGGYVTPLMAAAGSRVFFGVSNAASTPQVNTLYALDAFYGTTDWTFSLSGYGLGSAPVDVNGTLYVTDTTPELYALNDATGALLWKAPLGANYYAFTSAIAGELNGLVFARVYDQTSTEDAIEALRTTDGSVAWSTLIPTGSYGLDLDSSDSTLYATDGNGNLYALNATTGAQLWTATAVTFYVASGGIALIAPYSNTATTLEAVGATTGAVQWQFDVGSNYTSIGTQVVLTDQSDPAGPSVYFGAATYNPQSQTYGPITVYALNATTGAERWAYVTAEPFQPQGPDNTLPELGVSYFGVFYADTTGSAVFIYGLNNVTGTQLWRTELDVPPSAYPPIGGMTVGDAIGVSSYVLAKKSKHATQRH